MVSSELWQSKKALFARAYWPLLVSGVILLIVIAQVVTHSRRLNDGHLVYALDDAYIHMSIAKNFAQHGVWGVTQYGYSSTSSSPLWTLLLVLVYFITGVNEIAPLILNILLALALLGMCHHILTRCTVPALYRFIILLAIIILLPLNTLVLAGMEHVLQLLVCAAFLYYGAALLSMEKMPPVLSWPSYRLWLLGALTGTARYEGLFLVLIFCGLFALRWRVMYAVLLGAFSALPTVIYGLIAAANGWTFLPTSLLLKSDAGYLSGASFDALLTYFFVDTFHIFANQHVMSTMVLAALFIYVFRYTRGRSFWDSGQIMLLAFVLITFVNVRLVSWPDSGTFRRYEAYLVLLALLAIPAALGADLPRRVYARYLPAYIIAGLLLMFLMQDIYARYTFLAFENPVVTATENIYRQQYQMAHFLNDYYDGAAVAANDIGAINYFARIDAIDLFGLGTIEVARAKDEGLYNTGEMDRIVEARGGRIAVIYANWFDAYGGLPPEWTLVGQWQLGMTNVILGNDTVSFYALLPDEVETLAANLRAYSPRLPQGVIESGLYMRTSN